MLYPITTIIAIDQATGARVENGSGYVYALSDTARTTPLSIFDLSGLPLPSNLLTTNSEALIPPFQVDGEWQVVFVSGDSEIILTSYLGLKEEAAASANAANEVAVKASNGEFKGAQGDSAYQVWLAEGNVGTVADYLAYIEGPPGKDGSNVLPTDEAITQAIQDTASSTRGALNATYATKDTDALRWFRTRLGSISTDPVDVLAVGDSTMEGARSATKAGRWIDQVLAALRDKYQPASIKGGTGYIPAVYTPGVPFAGATWEYFAGGNTDLFTDSFTGGSGDLSVRAGWVVPSGWYTLDGADALTQNANGGVAYADVNSAADRTVSINATFATFDATVQYFTLIPMYEDGTGNKVQLEAVLTSTRSDWRIVKSIGGTVTTMAAYATSPVPVDPSGDAFSASVTVDGLTVTTNVNGSTLSANLTQADKDALDLAEHTGFQLPAVGSKLHDYAVDALVAAPTEVYPALDAGYGLGRRSLHLGPNEEANQSVITLTGTAVDVIVTTLPGGGTLDVTIDGTAAAGIETASATESLGQATRYTFAAGSHTLELSCASGDAIVEGIMVYDGDESAGLRLWESAHVGYNAASFTINTKWSESLKALTVPDLAFVALGLNDYKAQTFTPAQFKTNIETIISEIRESNPNVSVVLHNSWERGDVANPTYPWVDFVQAMDEITAADPGVMLVDLNAQLLGWNLVDPALRTIWDADTVHLSPAGYNVTANAITAGIT